MTKRYDVHGGVAMMRNWLDTLEAKTGRDVDGWTKLVLTQGPAGTKERREWLKREHGLGTNSAIWIVDKAEGGTELEDGDPDKYLARAGQYVEAMFAGPKAALRPLYDRLYALARELGDDIRISPAKTIVPIYRHHVIAQIKPTTRTRIDLGLALGDTPEEGRLLDTGGFAKKDRITHRIAIAGTEDIDGFVKKWMRTAYLADR
jgi:hypothetical protein